MFGILRSSVKPYGLSVKSQAVKQTKVNNFSTKKKVESLFKKINNMKSAQDLFNSMLKKRNSVEDGQVDKTIGLKKFLTRTYLYTGAGITGSLSSGLIMGSFFGMSSPFLLMGTGMATSFAGLYYINKIRPRQITNKFGSDESDAEYMTVNPTSRKVAYGVLVTGMGLVMAPALYVSPAGLVVGSAVLSSLIFSSCAAYAYRYGTKKILGWRMPLTVGLVGMVGMGFLSLGSSLIFGPNMFSSLWFTFNTYAGIALFTGISIYDTQKAMIQYKNKDADHLYCSTEMFLDWINIFVRMLEILRKLKD